MVSKLWTAAYNPHIFLIESFAFKAYTVTNIFEMWIEKNYIYTLYMYILYNVCMPSGAGFAKAVIVAALSVPGCSVETQRFVKVGRGHNCFYLL